MLVSSACELAFFKFGATGVTCLRLGTGRGDDDGTYRALGVARVTAPDFIFLVRRARLSEGTK